MGSPKAVYALQNRMNEVGSRLTHGLPTGENKMSTEEIPFDKLTPQERPLAPWSRNESLKMFEKSQSDGHRKLSLKCGQCGLEYSIFTWRDEPAEKLCSNFKHCPECGSVGESSMIGLDHELGQIFAAHSRNQ